MDGLRTNSIHVLLYKIYCKTFYSMREVTSQMSRHVVTEREKKKERTEHKQALSCSQRKKKSLLTAMLLLHMLPKVFSGSLSLSLSHFLVRLSTGVV